MKKIFITSGIVMCLVCPAFAADVDIPAETQDVDCSQESFGGATDGEVDFEARWAPGRYGPITLDSARYASADATTAVSSATVGASPAPLFSVYEVGIYSSETDADSAVQATLDETTVPAGLNALTTTPEMTGYTFGGFYTGKTGTGTKVINADGSILLTGDQNAINQIPTNENGSMTWYANWTANKSGIITLNSARYASADATAASSFATSVVSPTELYSVYETNLYNAATDEVVSSVTIPTMTGYTFGGFYTGKAGTGTQVIGTNGGVLTAASTQVTDEGATAEWYANWNANTYNAIYHVGKNAVAGATDYTDVDSVTYDAIYTTLPLATTGITAADGYTFRGWSQNQNAVFGTDTLIGAGSQMDFAWTTAGDLNLYAIYSQNQYQIIYNGGFAGGNPVTTVAMNSKGVEFDETDVVLDGNTYSATGYYFGGWSGNYAKDGTYTPTGTAYSNEDTIPQYKVVGDLTLTAQWNPNETTITYSCGTESDISGMAPNSDIATYDADFDFAENASCAKTGHEFTGWACSDNNGDLTSADMFGATGGTSTWKYEGENGGTITCVAQYDANTITLNWYDDTEENNGTLITEGVVGECTYGEGITLPNPQPTKPGYEFKGWKVRQKTTQP